MDEATGRAKLLALRNEIDAIDERLLDVLAERYVVTRQVGVVKRDARLPPADPAREAQMYERLAERSRARDLDPEVVVDIYKTLLTHVKEEHAAIASETRQ